MDQSVLNAIMVLSPLSWSGNNPLLCGLKNSRVIEDPKIDLVDEVLPGANCGGCGYAGCRAFAEAIGKG